MVFPVEKPLAYIVISNTILLLALHRCSSIILEPAENAGRYLHKIRTFLKEETTMSHWKKFTNDVLTNTKTETLRTSLAEMNVELDTTIKQISNTWGKEPVDMGFKHNGRVIALGLKDVGEGKMELRGDFYGTGLNESQFMDKLSQTYQKHNIQEKLQLAGWSIDEVSVDANGEILIDAYQYA